MAQIAEEQAAAIASARASCLSRAVDLAPEQPEPLRALCELYQRGERYDDLVELLRERVLIERNAAGARRAAPAHRAGRCGERLNDADGALDAWRKLLQIKRTARRSLALQQRARERDDAEQLVAASWRAWPRSSPSREHSATCCSSARSLLVRRLNQPGAGDRRPRARADRARSRASSRRSPSSSAPREAAADYPALRACSSSGCGARRAPTQQIAYARSAWPTCTSTSWPTPSARRARCRAGRRPTPAIRSRSAGCAAAVARAALSRSWSRRSTRSTQLEPRAGSAAARGDRRPPSWPRASSKTSTAHGSACCRWSKPACRTRSMR